MALSRFARNRKADASVPLLSGGRFLLAAAFVLLVIFPFFGKRLFGFIGGTGENAYSIDKGFADLITKVHGLQDDDVAVPHLFTVDDGFYLVGFNYAENTNGKATKPPDCNGIACFCVCTDPTCQKIDVNKNRGRDCRPLPGYIVIAAQKGIKGNDGAVQPNKYVRTNSVEEEVVNYFYIKGEETVAVSLKREKLENEGIGLYIRGVTVA